MRLSISRRRDRSSVVTTSASGRRRLQLTLIDPGESPCWLCSPSAKAVAAPANVVSQLPRRDAHAGCSRRGRDRHREAAREHAHGRSFGTSDQNPAC